MSVSKYADAEDTTSRIYNSVFFFGLSKIENASG